MQRADGCAGINAERTQAVPFAIGNRFPINRDDARTGTKRQNIQIHPALLQTLLNKSKQGM
jgi:hypothetical protein